MLNIIPKPYKAALKDGFFTVNNGIKVFYDGIFKEAFKFISAHSGIELTEAAEEKAVIKIIKDENLKSEGYILDINKDKVIIRAKDNGGVLYAFQTIRQIAVKEKDIKLPCSLIEDFPRFNWRGIMLDESRHFFGTAEVKRLLDNMFYNKLNIFHWHLTDDQGWRIEIKKYPLLTEIGSVRKGTHINGWRNSDLKKDVIWEEYKGFYTQEQIKEIVNYAKERNISVVPEIDMPAHFAAAMAAYPYLGCRELKTEVPYYFGGKIPLEQGVKDWNRSSCAGKESTYRFIFDVLDEISELFPFPYFHIGGDEAPKDEWTNCPHCQKAIKDNNLKDTEALQGYFNNRINEYLKKKGRRLIGWNEILNTANLDKDIIGQYWTRMRDTHAENFVNNGGELILSRHQSFYFDMPYSLVSLKETYNFKVIKQGIKKESEQRIKGMEGTVWTEWIDGREKLDLNLYPRMQALAEVCWTAEENKDYKDFLKRLEQQKAYFKKQGINYADITVADPKCRFKRIKDTNLWHSKDQYFEVKRNKEIVK